MKSNKGLLVVSFGTTHKKTCEETIGAVEEHLAKAIPSRKLYRAWTSRFIIKKIKERDKIKIDSIDEALDRMKKDEIRDVLIVPTHMIKGLENKKIRDAVEGHDGFGSIRIAGPLIDDQEDIRRLAEGVAEELFSDSKGRDDRALVLMGHGSSKAPETNEIYSRIQDAFRDMGYDNVFIGTVEGTPSLEDVMAGIKARTVTGQAEDGVCPQTERLEILLAPLMIVAGDHAINDMAGDEEGSWKRTLEDEIKGSIVRPVLRGLGSYRAVQEMIAEHGLDAEKG